MHSPRLGRQVREGPPACDGREKEAGTYRLRVLVHVCPAQPSSSCLAARSDVGVVKRKKEKWKWPVCATALAHSAFGKALEDANWKLQQRTAWPLPARTTIGSETTTGRQIVRAVGLVHLPISSSAACVLRAGAVHRLRYSVPHRTGSLFLPFWGQFLSPPKTRRKKKGKIKDGVNPNGY